MTTVQFPGCQVHDWHTFHEVSKEVFGFPTFYGMNMDAWIDCLTYLDDGMSRFELRDDELLNIEVLDSEFLRNRLPDVFDALQESVDFINRRNSEAGERPKIKLTLR